uniref:Cytochrome P450 n=1 Tax=Oryza brachyantha TaxID=4533 RepID=J3MRN9_ORYBR
MAPFLQELVVSPVTILVLVLSYIAYWRSKHRLLLPVDWPLVGLLPSLVANLRNLHDYVTAVLAASGQSFAANAPAATNMRLFITCDPDNVRHIFTANHENYPKGHEFAEIFDVMAGSFFTMDGEPSRRPRAEQSILGDPRVVASMVSSCHDKVRGGLVPLLASMASRRTPVEVQDLATRLMFDVTAMAVFGVDPGCLSPDMPSMRVSAGMDTIMEVGLFRHTVPACWKAMRRLKVGPERKLAAAHAVLHGFVTEMMEKAKKYRHGHGDDEAEEKRAAAAPPPSAVDILSSYINDPDYNADGHLLRTMLITYMVAGPDTVGTTLSWFFYNLAMNPHVVSAIRHELAPIASRNKAAATSTAATTNGDHHTAVMFSPEDTKPLVYLQAALFETLRLYPPGPIERKTVVADDVMPRGHEVRAGDAVLISLYAMGRMEALWGKDWREYRPERWLTVSVSGDGGGRKKQLRYVPSHKFLAFNSGPRMCHGKHIAVAQMKTVAAAVVWNFDVEVVGGQAVEPKLSCLLQMKNGLVVKVKRRAV